jgi:hypothetical protein
MPITLDELDGQYQVHSETSQDGKFIVNGDGLTTVKDGFTYRKDKNGCIWESSFSIAGPNKVEIESTIDPSHADTFILDEKGNPTKSMVRYRTILNVETVDGKIILSGTVEHGTETTRLTMKKV